MQLKMLLYHQELLVKGLHFSFLIFKKRDFLWEAPKMIIWSTVSEWHYRALRHNIFFNLNKEKCAKCTYGSSQHSQSSDQISDYKTNFPTEHEFL